MFRQQKRAKSGTTFTVVNNSKPKPKPPVNYIMILEDQFDEDDLEAVRQAALATGDAKMVLRFKNIFSSRTHWDRAIELFEQSDSMECMLEVAESYQQRGDESRAMELFVRLRTMAWLSSDTSNLSSRINRLGEKLGIENSHLFQPDVAMLEQLGAVEATAENFPIEAEIGLDEPLVFYHRDEEGKLNVLALSVELGASGSPQLAFVAPQGGGKSWGTKGMNKSDDKWSGTHTSVLSGKAIIRCRVISTDQPGKFRMTVTLDMAAR